MALPDEVRRIHAAGDELGNHSWSHPFLPDLTAQELRDQLDRTAEELDRLDRPRPDLVPAAVRVPDPQVLAALDGHPTTVTMWDVDARDWSRPGPEQIAATVLEGAGPGAWWC
ncbi:Polysaccharide deacetylase family protein OS=Streptomyces microflavus OX=1919 GN=HUT09_15120 PE=4 SV=1 [Streptomyces microflavus]